MGNKGNKIAMVSVIGLIVLLAVVILRPSTPLTAGTTSAPVQTSPAPTIQTALGTECALGIGKATLSYVGYDALNTGTNVVVSTKTKVNDGVFSSSVTQSAAGADLQVLLINNTDYHDQLFTDLKVPCSSEDFRIERGLLKNTSGTTQLLTVMNSPDGNLMTNGGGATNQTMASGDAPTLTMNFQGVDKASTNDMVCILESSNSTEMDEILLNGQGAIKSSKGKPSFYSLDSVRSEIWVYEVPAITGVGNRVFSFTPKSASGKDVSRGKFIIDCFGKRWFLDPLGDVRYDIQDSQGTQKSINHYQFTGFFD